METTANTSNNNTSPPAQDLAAALQSAMPVLPAPYPMTGRRVGLVVVDEVAGFCTVGAGPLAPPAPNAQVTRMIETTVREARRFQAAGHPILAFLDTHEPGKAEPPYPPHCEIGSGQEELVPELRWLDTEWAATLVRKDCINGWIGAHDPATGSNAVTDWVLHSDLDAVVCVGICTDICVMDFVLTLLSARNHGLLGRLKDIVVLEPGCATYDLPAAVARDLGLPASAAHPQEAAHHLGLYFMASRGAIIADSLV